MNGQQQVGDLITPKSGGLAFYCLSKGWKQVGMVESGEICLVLAAPVLVENKQWSYVYVLRHDGRTGWVASEGMKCIVSHE